MKSIHSITLLLLLSTVSSCAIMQEDPLPSDVKKTSRSNIVKISNTSRYQASPDVILVNSIEKAADGSYVLSISEEESATIGIASETYEKYIQIVEQMNARKK